MAGYQRVYADVWDQPWDQDVRYLAFYLMTCQHRVTEGLYRLPQPYVWADLNWSPQRFEEAFGELIDDGFVEYDAKAQVILLPGALVLQQPANPNNVKAALKAIERLPKTHLLQRFYGLAERFAKPLAEGLAERFAERLAEPIGNSPSPAPSQPISSEIGLHDSSQPTMRDSVNVVQPDLSLVEGVG